MCILVLKQMKLQQTATFSSYFDIVCCKYCIVLHDIIFLKEEH